MACGRAQECSTERSRVNLRKSERKKEWRGEEGTSPQGQEWMAQSHTQGRAQACQTETEIPSLGWAAHPCPHPRWWDLCSVPVCGTSMQYGQTTHVKPAVVAHIPPLVVFGYRVFCAKKAKHTSVSCSAANQTLHSRSRAKCRKQCPWFTFTATLCLYSTVLCRL